MPNINACDVIRMILIAVHGYSYTQLRKVFVKLALSACSQHETTSSNRPQERDPQLPETPLHVKGPCPRSQLLGCMGLALGCLVDGAHVKITVDYPPGRDGRAFT